LFFSRTTIVVIAVQPTVNPEASESLLCSLANRSLRLNNSMPSLVQTLFASQRRHTAVGCAGIQSQKALTLDSIRCSIPHSHSFAAAMPSSTHDLANNTVGTPVMVREDRADSTSFISDSGVWSPVSEEPEQEKAKPASPENLQNDVKDQEDVVNKDRRLEEINWRELTIGTKLPLLSADILNFDAVFSCCNVDLEPPLF
ncbi:hypothetical protein ANCCAN_18884, partial [Ancylostoma caninum]